MVAAWEPPHTHHHLYGLTASPVRCKGAHPQMGGPLFLPDCWISHGRSGMACPGIVRPGKPDLRNHDGQERIKGESEKVEWFSGF